MPWRLRQPLSFDGVQGFLDTLFGDDLHANGRSLWPGHARGDPVRVAGGGQGPALARRRLTKHAVKQVDRLLSNEGIESMPCWRIWCLTWSV
jgi:hypothetical protein